MQTPGVGGFPNTGGEPSSTSGLAAWWLLAAAALTLAGAGGFSLVAVRIRR
jgi:hypothetical protein